MSVVVLSPQELEALVKKAVREALSQALLDMPNSGPITDEEKAAMRKRLRKLGIGV